MANAALGQDFLIGQTLGHYRIVERIGEGGMGVVYRAIDEHLNRDVAVKVLPQYSLSDENARLRFRKEAHALSKLNHPNIATVYDFESSDRTDYLAEELISGVSLAEMLASGPLSERELVTLGCQLCEGLACAHDHGIIHRDIKPGNIRLTPDAQLKILDFGLAKTLRPASPIDNQTATLSETQIVSGTLPYISPEQLRNEKLDARIDIWATGCVLFEMATGRRPFLGQGTALIDEILHQPVPSIGRFNPRISTAIDGIIQKCLDKDSAKRYHSAREIVVDLKRAASAPIVARIRLRWRSWLVRLVLTLAALALVVVGIREFPGLTEIFGKDSSSGIASLQSVPHESYLAGLKSLERWDRAGNLDSAITLFRQSVNADPGFALGFSGLGEAYWAKYRLDRDSRWMDEAERNCHRAAELNSQLPAIYVTLAKVHNGKGQFNLALQEIQQALRFEPNAPDALLGEAAVYASLGRQDEAESIYRKAASLRPHYWGGYYELGAFYFRHRRFADAAEAFQRALEITPDNAVVHATLGGMMQIIGKDSESEEHLRRSLELQPSYVAYNNLGALYYRQRRWAESAAMLRKALAINANDWQTWANLGIAEEWLNQSTEVGEVYRNELSRIEEAARISPEDTGVQSELAALYAKAHQREKALPLIEAVLARAPENPSVLANAAEAYEYLGDRERALKFAESALAQGWTIAQLQKDFGLRNLLRDPRFEAIARATNSRTSPAQKTP